jgi:hypothetical protein
MAATLAELKKSPLYSEQLGIVLARDDDQEYFKWFLASLLFGGRISETIARHTYQAFAEHGLLTPRKILNAGWDYLVNPVMREGGYVRYDGRKSAQILRNCEQLLTDYTGSPDPEPLPVVDELATELGIDLNRFMRKTLTFCRIEAGLIGQRRLLRKRKGG